MRDCPNVSGGIDLGEAAFLPLAPFPRWLKRRFAASGVAFLPFIADRLNSRLPARADATILRPGDGFLFARRELFRGARCFAAIGFLFFINIDERNDSPVNLVVGCAVRADAERIVPTRVVSHSVFIRDQRSDDFPETIFQIWDMDVWF
jgi:hypothetical protein